MDCSSLALSTTFQAYQADERVTVKGFVQRLLGMCTGTCFLAKISC